MSWIVRERATWAIRSFDGGERSTGNAERTSQILSPTHTGCGSLVEHRHHLVLDYRLPWESDGNIFSVAEELKPKTPQGSALMPAVSLGTLVRATICVTFPCLGLSYPGTGFGRLHDLMSGFPPSGVVSASSAGRFSVCMRRRSKR